MDGAEEVRAMQDSYKGDDSWLLRTVRQKEKVIDLKKIRYVRH